MCVATDSRPVELTVIIVLTVPSLDLALWLRRVDLLCGLSYFSVMVDG